MCANIFGSLSSCECAGCRFCARHIPFFVGVRRPFCTNLKPARETAPRVTIIHMHNYIAFNSFRSRTSAAPLYSFPPGTSTRPLRADTILGIHFSTFSSLSSSRIASKWHAIKWTDFPSNCSLPHFRVRCVAWVLAASLTLRADSCVHYI